jgi:glucose/arabinose dehydrogenase
MFPLLLVASVASGLAARADRALAAPCDGIPTVPGDAVATELVTAALAAPVFVTAPPLDTRRLFVVEQEGVIRVIEDGVLLAEPFLDHTAAVSCCSERGMFSVAFDPDYATNRRFFVYYTDNRGRLTLARFKTSPDDPNRAKPESRRIVLRIPHPGFGNHNGGQLAFGPDDHLYMATGDGGGGGDPGENAQDPTSLLGKMLRIDVDVLRKPFRAVPPDNPNPAAGAKLGLIWGSGLRNPWRFSFDRANGDLYVADVGQNVWEEVNATSLAASRGANYGWDHFEAAACFEPPPPATTCPPRAQFVFPVVAYSHSEGCSISGGHVYRGCRMPDLAGTYFYADFCTSFVRSFRGYTGGAAQEQSDRTAELAPGGGRTLDRIVSFGEDARGELYVVDRDGELYRIVPGS